MTAVVNGFESRSVAHNACLRLVMTGTPQTSGDDWPSRIASTCGSDVLLPMVHMSGPSYTYEYGASVVRVGSHNQLPSLIAGSAAAASKPALTSNSSGA